MSTMADNFPLQTVGLIGATSFVKSKHTAHVGLPYSEYMVPNLYHIDHIVGSMTRGTN